ncbi:hypothetical protein ONZ45_g18499 [Pleurotus djamor]|nr:hypothetical protein ONZ45_g18499 [Pleurotus djamor]
MQYIGPVLLQRKFRKEIYYTHFVELVRLVRLCLQFEISSEEIDEIREGFSNWVLKYEKLYYQYSPDRLATCPLTIHGLLHIADGITEMGPVWAYWAFPMERYCGKLQRGIKSRRFPFASLDNFVLYHAQLSHIKTLYALEDQLSLSHQRDTSVAGQLSHPDYPTCVLLPPKRASKFTTAPLVEKILISLATRYDTNIRTIRPLVNVDRISQWACVRRLEGGDDMRALALYPKTSDRRDATFIRYEMLVDINAHRPRARSVFQPKTFYGQLENIFVVHISPSRTLSIAAETTLILAGVRQCNVTTSSTATSVSIQHYSDMGPYEVIDMAQRSPNTPNASEPPTSTVSQPSTSPALPHSAPSPFVPLDLPVDPFFKSTLYLLEYMPGMPSRSCEDHAAKCLCCTRARVYMHDARKAVELQTLQMGLLASELQRWQDHIQALCTALRSTSPQAFQHAVDAVRELEGFKSSLRARMEALAAELNVSVVELENHGKVYNQLRPLASGPRHPLGLQAVTCARGPDGQLLPASRIDFIYDPDNPLPMPAAPEDDEVGISDNHSDSRPARMRRTTTKGKVALESLRQDEYGRLESKFRTKPRTQATTRSKTTKSSVIDGEEEEEWEDTDFVPQSDGSLSEDEVGEITNAELAASLPAKIVPTATKRRRQSSKSSPPQIKRTRSGTVSEPMSQPELSDASSAPRGGKRNPIYLFYEEVKAPINAPFPKGERRYVCYHDGARKQMKVTAGMKYSTTGLVQHLRKFPLQFRLYEVLKNRKQPPTAQEIEVAANRIPMTPESLSTFVRAQEKQSADIRDLFDKQKSKDKATFKQDLFDKLLTEWIVSCDQPFTEVDRPEFRALIDYVYQTGDHKEDLQIPSHTTVRTKIMDNGEKSMKAMVEMFSKLDSKVSLSLDAWTSSNQYAFLAIVAHFVSNDGILEEILIDFQELIGAHTGANLAEVVWRTMTNFGLVGKRKVVAIVMDNASNNDTLMSTLEGLHHQFGYDFPAKSSRLRCIPHTVHLAALRLLEGIGALSPSDRTRAAGQEGQYQSIVTGDDDDDEMDLGDEDDDDEVPELVEAVDPNILDVDKISLSVSRVSIP